MGDFDIIECGYNIADETINFGTRALADGDNLHEVSTLATLKCSEENQGRINPHINATVQNGSLYFNVDTFMKIFKDTQCSDVIFNAGFEAIVDTFCVSLDGRYLLICLRNGMVKLIDCNNEYTCVFQTSCERDDNGDRFFINTFLDSAWFLIVTKTGQVYRMSLERDFKMECVHEFNFKAEIASFQYPFLLVNGARLAILDLENNNVIDDCRCDFKRIFPFTYVFLALDFEGNLYRICPITLAIVPINNCLLYKDMQLISDSNQKQIIVVGENESQQTFIQLLSYPDLEELFSLKVSADQIHLISLESVNDEMLYISKILKDQFVTEIRFHMVYETEPEQRLRRLLKKHNYKDAERFATLFNLDKSLINKAKAQEITEKPVCNSADLNNLIQLLNIIEDDEFKLQCCLDVESSCTFEDIGKILNYGCQIQLKKQERRLAVEELQKSVIDLKFRYDTFVTINRGDQGIQLWLQFASCDLIEEVKLLLRNFKVEEAMIIYSRLDEVTCRKLTEADISDIITVLNSTTISTYQQFLPTFIPITLSILPSTLPLFVKWTYSNVFYLENRGKADFPNNAIKFTENIVGLMRVGDVGDISFQRQCVLHRESLVDLSSLLSTLKSLKTLKDEYSISIPVMDYLSGPLNVVRLLLSVKMCSEDYDFFLKHFLCKYIVENGMELNEILLGEIMNLMKYDERYWIHTIGSILSCISSVEVKLEAVKSILGIAAVPWSDNVRKIANDSLKYFHVMTSEIRELIENEPMQVVLSKPKYLIKEKRMSSLNDLKFVLKRIIYCNEPTMLEDVYKLCNSPEKRHEANMLLTTHFIRLGCSKKAMEILDDNDPEEILKCAKELAVMAETVVNSGIGLSDKLTNNYYDVVGSIFKRLNDRSNEFERSCNEKTLDLIRNVYNLNKHFGIKKTTYDLRRSKNKNEIVDGILEEARCEFVAGKQTIDGVFVVCHKLSTSLSLDNDEILMRFCEKAEDYNVILKTAQCFYERESSAKNLCLITVLLLKYVGTYKLQLLDNSLSESEGSMILADSDDGVFYKGLQLAQSIIAKAIYKETPDDVPGSLEIARWVDVSFYFTRNEASELSKMLFGDIFDCGSVPPGFITFNTIKNVFNAYCNFLGSLNNPKDYYLTRFKSATFTADELFNELKLLPSVLETMSKEGQHFTSYKLVATLQNSLIQTPDGNSAIFNFLRKISMMFVPKVLSSILSNNFIDTDLLYNLLLLYDRDQSIEFMVSTLRKYKRYPRKLECLTRTAVRLFQHHGIPTQNSEMINTLTTLKWWKKFESKKLDYDHFFKSKPESRLELLIKAECLDLELMKEYCQDYNLNLSASYNLLFKRTFQNWKPDYEIKNDIHRKYLVVKNSEDELFKKCQDIMGVLDKQNIGNIITSIWNSVNTYYYEVFIAMINILSLIDPQRNNNKQLSTLIFLKNYQRVSKPSEAEIEQWYTSYPDTQSLDILSEFRLSFAPFLFTKEIFQMIRPEINLQTYKLWFNAIDILKPYLNKNEICSFVVKDVVASGVLSKDATGSWNLHAKHDDLLKQIDECVMNISDLELSTSVVYHLMTHTPNGADQVSAARLCYKYAARYKKLNPESSTVEKAVIKVEKKYFTYCAMHILYTYDLAEKKYLNLLTRANELIVALYMDDRILLKNEVDLQCPNINKAAEDIAALFNLDIKEIRLNLVKNWLENNNPQLDFDSSMIISSEACSDEDSLNRIAYVCCADDLEYWQKYIVQMCFGKETEEQRNVHCKARVLKVFAMISDVETIVNMLDLTYDEFINYIDKLTIVSNLQYLGISLDIEALDQYNKKELLNRLVQRAGNILAVKTMALISTTYHICDAKYWEFICNSSIKFSMFVELKTYVNYLKKAKYQYKTFYVNAWQKLIDYSFAHMSLSQNLDKVLLNNFLTIQSCPVLFALNFDNAFRRCMDRDKVEFAAVLLQYLDGNRRDEYVKEIRNSNKDLDASLNNLDQNGLWGISHVKAILARR